MPDRTPLPVRVEPVAASDEAVAGLLNRLTAELAQGGYTDEQTFGYTVEQLEAAGVRMVGAYHGSTLVGVAGIELTGDSAAELKRFYVEPAARGSGVADALLAALLDDARAQGVTVVRLETGDKQAAAIRFYRRRGFAPIARFGPYVDSETSVCLQRLLDAAEPLS